MASLVYERENFGDYQIIQILSHTMTTTVLTSCQSCFKGCSFEFAGLLCNKADRIWDMIDN